jgi:hypothetical protein
MSLLSKNFDFLTADYKSLLADDSAEAVEQLEWLLPTASLLVERETARRGISEWQLLQRRHDVEDAALQHALDVLEAGGFIVPDHAECTSGSP